MGSHRLTRTGASEAGTTTPGAPSSCPDGADDGPDERRAGNRYGPLSARTRIVAIVSLTAAGLTGLATALPAWADTSPFLRDRHVLAATGRDQGTGNCGVAQRPDQDVWVFGWPGGDAGSLERLTVRYDTDGNDQADTSRTELDAVNLSASPMQRQAPSPSATSAAPTLGRKSTAAAAGDRATTTTLEYAVTTPAGWVLIDGTSLITGTSSQNQFRLVSVCAGQGSPASAPVPGDAGPGSVPGSPSPGIRSTAGPGAPGAVGSVSAGASSAGDAAVSAAPLGASGGGSAAGGGADPGGSDVSRSGGSLFTLPRGRDARLVAAARPVLPYIAGALVLVAVGSVLVGLRRRRAEAWADAAAGWFGPGNTGRHRRA